MVNNKWSDVPASLLFAIYDLLFTPLMKTLYFDCFAGASGDMILGALVAAGVEPRALTEQLQSLKITGWKMDFEAVDRSGISSTYARVQTAHEHTHRHLKDILAIIYDSGL